MHWIYYVSILASILLRNLLSVWLWLLKVNFILWLIKEILFASVCVCVRAHVCARVHTCTVGFNIFFIIEICKAPWFSRLVFLMRSQQLSTTIVSNSSLFSFFNSSFFTAVDNYQSELSTPWYVSPSFSFLFSVFSSCSYLPIYYLVY